MDPLETRRLFMEDGEWERTSISWKTLIPLRDLNCRCVSDESPRQHYLRLRPRFNIPLEVIEQWLYPHYYNRDTVNNYGWLDYDIMGFEETLMSARQLAAMHVIGPYRSYVRTRELNHPFDGFACSPKDVDLWREKGTWRVPPVVIDVTTIRDIPPYAELADPLQLVEGHSRFGYLLAMRRAGLITDDSTHRAYRMYIQEGDGA